MALRNAAERLESLNGKAFGERRLLGTLHENRSLGAASILSNVERAVEQFRSSGQQQDDLTLVVARGR